MHVPETRGAELLGLVAILVVVAAYDWRARRIPNLLVGPLAALGLAHAAFFGGAGALAASLVGMAGGLALLLLPMRAGVIGAGDVKLLAAVGAWTGLAGAIWVLVVGSVAGGVLAVLALVRLSREERRSVVDNVAGALSSKRLELPATSGLSRARGIPFGVGMVAATVLHMAVLR